MQRLLKTFCFSLGLQISSLMSSRPRTELIELGLIGAIFLFLPFKEAPKNILLLAYICMWIANRYRDGRWGGKDYKFEGPLILIVLLGIFGSCYVAENKIESLIDGIDFLTMTLLAIVLKRSVCKPDHIVKVIIVATGIGIGFSVMEGWIFGYQFPSLRSVGHINHVAIFLLIYFTVVLSLFATARGVTQSVGLLWLLLTILVLMFSTNSRNAAFSAILTLFSIVALMLFFGYRRKVFAIKISAVLAATAVVFLTFAPGLVQKQLSHYSRGSLDADREKVWKAASIASQKNTLFGYGVGNFAFATSEQNLRLILQNESKIYESDQYLHTNHAHNLFYNWLVERGLFALLMLYGWIILLFTRTFIFARRYQRSISAFGLSPTGSISKETFVFILISVPLSIVSMGFWNTTFHHEHGIFAISVIAVAYRDLFFGRDCLSHSQNVSNAAS